MELTRPLRDGNIKTPAARVLSPWRIVEPTFSEESMGDTASLPMRLRRSSRSNRLRAI